MTTRKNRKEATCRCGRSELIAAENELDICGRCALLKAEAYNKKKQDVDLKTDLRKKIDAKKISLRSLAYDLGISRDAIEKMLSGKRRINTKVYKWMTGA